MTTESAAAADSGAPVPITRLSTHVLDTTIGRPAAGIPATLEHLRVNGEAIAVGHGTTDPDGRIRATFDIIWLSGWAPHESQQQPLKPGSAKASLEAAVKKMARAWGEKA